MFQGTCFWFRHASRLLGWLHCVASECGVGLCSRSRYIVNSGRSNCEIIHVMPVAVRRNKCIYKCNNAILPSRQSAAIGRRIYQVGIRAQLWPGQLPRCAGLRLRAKLFIDSNLIYTSTILDTSMYMYYLIYIYDHIKSYHVIIVYYAMSHLSLAYVIIHIYMCDYR